MALRFYHRDGCHLCEQALELLQAAGLAQGLNLVDIDEDAQLGADYGLRIPVLERADGQSLDWPFDAVQVRAFSGGA
ncbi:MAG: glutaredoxin family protein [Leptolyngbya sp. UWPOB_LEPTO1]|uniref:glutaredoxin family protein n=1 Tax=Leptolyngbya sp. UWPOB_LEPTO1 TaxID=2815653 RepID=UPI001AC5F1E9|nr:glutaredoxin family protein [Leptolyngbya sp. UWPOB_LEPTO1]MBN8564352.1 glutaredoxin family protein [Leptolyngbya sp. UWPOB_LEPTO1]